MKSGLAPDIADAYAGFSVTPRALQATIDEGRSISESLDQAGAVTSFGAIPLIVLSRGLDQRDDWERLQTELLKLSSDSQQLIADKSGHNVQLDHPEAAVRAIVQMIEHIRMLDDNAHGSSAS